MTFNYNDIEYKVNIIRKNNKNLYIRVINNEIIVTCNYLITNKQIIKIINDNKNTIIKMIDKSNKKEELNNKFIIFGKEYKVIYGYEFNIEDEIIYIENEKKLNKWLNNYILNTFNNHLMLWYNKFEENIPEPNLKIRKMKTRWGVCNLKNNNVTLNYELIKYDIECLDYVIVHELSHFIHPDHSKEFWELVSKYKKDYKILRKKLK